MSSRKSLPAMVQGLRQVFSEGRTREYSWRARQLEGLKRFLVEREGEILEAVAGDFSKPSEETWFTEVHYLLSDIDLQRRMLKSWMKPHRVHTPLRYQPGRSYYVCEPKGVVLVISAWNYPLQLALAPVAAALAAGNCIVLKPSELAPVTAALLSRRLPHYLDADAFKVVQGGPQETGALLAERFDHIFFTGSARVGRIVATAAAGFLTPCTLELGGKSPCIVDRDTTIGVAARRIVWAKFLNAGQTCISPDYVLVDRRVERQLLEALCRARENMYGHCSGQRPSYARVINEHHTRRLYSLMNGVRVVCGGRVDISRCMIEPTILAGVDFSSPVMQEEIFGPLLPVIAYDTADEAAELAARTGTPLALYIFSRNRKLQRFFTGRIRSGSVCINDLLFQAAVEELPFGGLGESGSGRYHGKAGFETFSIQRSVHVKRMFPENSLRYPPFSTRRFIFLKWLFRRFV
ncbi:aldehyde dehydrogenase family protein [Prosthecochloris sp. HL-130-GSB]|nr:aldehyde dehydrogenase family protein [Prosthecochloris sp. HL-130-GSB]